MGDYEVFRQQCELDVLEMSKNIDLKQMSLDWMIESSKHKYSYHFEWLGRPIIQFPQDIVALQEIIWKNRPDLIIETGIAHGGSLILNASILALLDMFDYENGLRSKKKRKVVGIDIDIRSHNRTAIENHPLGNRIEMFEGSSTAESLVNQMMDKSQEYERVMVILDSHHNHEHVLRELKLYGPMVTSGQYLIVFDTIIENFPQEAFADRDWSVGNKPMTAVFEFLASGSDFSLDKEIENRLLVTVAPNGFLKRK